MTSGISHPGLYGTEVFLLNISCELLLLLSPRKGADFFMGCTYNLKLSPFIPRLTFRGKSEKKNGSTYIAYLYHAAWVSESSDAQMIIFDTETVGRLILIKHKSRGVSSNCSSL